MMRASVIAVVALAVSCGKEEEKPKPSPKPILDFRAAYAKGADWLVSQQDKSGAWPSVGFTGLAVAGLAGGPSRENHKDAVDRGVSWLVSKQNKDDGSFGDGPSGTFYKTYDTAIALMALAAVDPEKHADPIRGARAYLKHNQMKEGVHRGGSGYGDIQPKGDTIKTKDYATMSTTGFAAEGMKMSGLPQDDEFWKLVVEFCRKVQNNTEVNKDKEWLAQLKEAGLSISDDNGLFYTPIADSKQASKAGTKKLTDREVILSYGAMTYEGIKTYLYAGLSKNSPEVKGAMDWIRKNYSVEAHPGFPFDATKRPHLTGIYYYYISMAKALDAYGELPLKTFDGKEHNWAQELGAQLAKLQQGDGSWKNENPRWFESIPVLTTSYVLLAGNAVLRNLK